MKAMIWGLMGAAFFLWGLSVLVGFFSQSLGGILFLISLVAIGFALYLGFRPGGILRKERAIDNWSVLIDEACMADGRERTDQLYKNIASFLAASEAPNLKVERQHLAPSLIRGLVGDHREFLVLTDVTNSRMKPYQIYISARPYGINLACEWYLTYKPTPLMAMLSLIPFVNLIPQALSDIDLFDQQDLRAYAANAHHCMLRAVSELMLYLNQDPTTLNRQSKGFFGVN
jgi:hypothetical protein